MKSLVKEENLKSKNKKNEIEKELSLDEMEELAACGEEISIFAEEESESFLPEASEEDIEEETTLFNEDLDLSGTELEDFDTVEIEEVEFIETEKLVSIVESILFATDRPVSLASIKQVFKGTNIKTEHVRKALQSIAIDYAGATRGVTLEEAPGGYQLRTKIDNMEFLKRTLKTRSFKLSGPALEVLAILSYKQPIIKSEIDEIRGVESGHLLRALMEKGLANFAGKSELPGKPMLYGTTKKFLEIFGLRSLKELPTLSEIDELLPDGITEDEGQQRGNLGKLSDAMAQEVSMKYSQGEEELVKITSELQEISVSTDFFEQEKKRQKDQREKERAENIREALALGEEVSNRDKNWLARYDAALIAGESFTEESAQTSSDEVQNSDNKTLEAKLEAEELEFAAEEETDEDDVNSEDFLNEYDDKNEAEL